MNERDRRIARTRLLRRQGKTYDEIREVIGSVDDGTLRIWCRGIPRPPETRRSHPHTALKRECRRLRGQGLTYEEVAALTGASTGSLSLWLRDIRVTPERTRRQGARPPRSQLPYAVAARASAEAVRAARRTAAFQSLGAVSDRELLTAGVALYIAEGSKAKPWRPRDRQVTFLNSDASVTTVFLAWLDLLGIPEERRSYRLSIHESADVAAHEQWWAMTLGLDPETFMRATLKRHNPKTVRKNVDADYHGCLIVRVRQPAPLYDAIEGWWHRLVTEATARRAEYVGCGSDSPGSSKGRTAIFGVAYGGSNPSPGADGSGSSLERLGISPVGRPPVGSQLALFLMDQQRQEPA